MTGTPPIRQRGRGQSEEQQGCLHAGTPPSPFSLGKLRQSLPSSTRWLGGSCRRLSISAGAGDRGAAPWGPALPWAWESPALAAAVPLCGRDEKKNNSWGFPSPPVLAPHRGPTGSFISPRQRRFHLPPGGANRSPRAIAATGRARRHRGSAQRCRHQMAGDLGCPARPRVAQGGGRSPWSPLLAKQPQSLAAPRCLQRNGGSGIPSGLPCSGTVPGLCQLSLACAQTQLTVCYLVQRREPRTPAGRRPCHPGAPACGWRGESPASKPRGAVAGALLPTRQHRAEGSSPPDRPVPHSPAAAHLRAWVSA